MAMTGPTVPDRRRCVMDAKSTGDKKGLIVVGLDGSDSGAAALDWAIAEGHRTGDPVKVITAWRWDAVAAEPMVRPDPNGIRRDALEAQNSRVRDVLERAGGDVLVTTDVVEGDAATVLVEASRDASILVIGSRGLGAIRSAILGSVSDHVVRHAHCPVLVVRPEHTHADRSRHATV
jgi:nucleotide-binding universal stress UspA family protein